MFSFIYVICIGTARVLSVVVPTSTVVGLRLTSVVSSLTNVGRWSDYDRRASPVVLPTSAGGRITTVDLRQSCQRRSVVRLRLTSFVRGRANVGSGRMFVGPTLCRLIFCCRSDVVTQCRPDFPKMYLEPTSEADVGPTTSATLARRRPDLSLLPG